MNQKINISESTSGASADPMQKYKLSRGETNEGKWSISLIRTVHCVQFICFTAIRSIRESYAWVSDVHSVTEIEAT